MLSRRQFLKLSAMTGGALALPWRLSEIALGRTTVIPGSLARFVDPLPIPPSWTAGQLTERGLTMASSMHRFHRDLGMTPTFGFGGATYLGPTIEARRGEPVTFLARNRLGPHVLGIDQELHGPDHYLQDHVAPRVSLHLHGGYTEPASDGYPEDVFTPGQDHVYRYDMDQQAGTTWYHDHALGITRLNVYAGLAAFFPIRDGAAEGGLPPRPFEIPIALQDKTFLDPGGGTNPMEYPDPWAPEFFGDVPVINGKAWPDLQVRRGLYRLRLLDGSSSRFYNLRLDPPVPWYLIGTEVGFVDAPIPITGNIVLAPGERADVLVDFSGLSPGDHVVLMNDQPLPEPVVSPVDDEGPFIFELMRFTALRQRGFPAKIPSSLASYPGPDPGAVVAERNLVLVEIVDPMTGEPVMALLNNRPWDTTDIERPTVHTLEQWNLINLTEDTHPIHLHLAQFRLRNRQSIDVGPYLEHVFGTEELTPADVGTGSRPFPSVQEVGVLAGPAVAPPPFEDGWKDTIQAHPGQVTRVLVPFGSGAGAQIPFGQSVTHTGEYVWHCHILDHEDNEMMLPYEVVT